MFLSASKDKVKAYQRELERTSISGSANASRVEVLEAKIKTLEKAFSAGSWWTYKIRSTNQKLKRWNW